MDGRTRNTNKSNRKFHFNFLSLKRIWKTQINNETFIFNEKFQYMHTPWKKLFFFSSTTSRDVIIPTQTNQLYGGNIVLVILKEHWIQLGLCVFNFLFNRSKNNLHNRWMNNKWIWKLEELVDNFEEDFIVL